MDGSRTTTQDGYLDRIESVWDYPRPPRLELVGAPVAIWLGGERIAHTTAAYRVLETSHPPTLYLPAAAFVDGALTPAPGGRRSASGRAWPVTST